MCLQKTIEGSIVPNSCKTIVHNKFQIETKKLLLQKYFFAEMFVQLIENCIAVTEKGFEVHGKN